MDKFLIIADYVRSMYVDRLGLGDYIRDAREAKRLSQRELAAQIARSRPWLTQLDRCRRELLGRGYCRDHPL